MQEIPVRPLEEDAMLAIRKAALEKMRQLTSLFDRTLQQRLKSNREHAKLDAQQLQQQAAALRRAPGRR